jgi:hypothetical protein
VGVGYRKGLRRGGLGREMRGRGCVHHGGRGREVREEEGADGWGPWAERERTRERAVSAGRKGPPDSRRERARERTDRRRQVGPTRQRARERETRERGHTLVPTGGVCLLGAAGA